MSRHELRQARYTEVAGLIQDYVKLNHFSPTVRELARSAGVSPSTMLYTLNEMEEKGFISRLPSCPRSIVVLE